jgi:L-ribulose-5-phosphate 3-epimerase
MVSRRNFLKTTAITGAFLPFANTMASEKTVGSALHSKIHFFSKPLDNYETEFMAETLAMAGIDGFDLTVRRGGKVDPGKVTEELPRIVETGKKYNVATEFMVTGITDAGNPDTRRVLETASSLGVRHYRLGYYSYDFSAGISGSLETIKASVKELSGMNSHFNIQGGYQNHDGERFGAPLWDIWQVIRDLPVEAMSSQFDIRHSVAEGYRSWVIALHLLSKNIGALAFKDFGWQVINGSARTVNVPLGEGVVDFKKFFQLVKELEIKVPYSLHIEYPLLSSSEEGYSLIEKQKIIVNKLKKEVRFIRDHENSLHA